LFNKTIVIAVPRPAPREIYFMILTIFFEVVVDELAARVTVKTLDWNRESLINIVSSLHYPFLGFIFQSPHFSPTEGYISRG
jgi:hypothetical protein